MNQRQARVVKMLIRGVLVPLGLGLYAVSREGYRFAAPLDFVAAFVLAYIVGGLLLGFLGLGVWLWNLLDLLGLPPGGSAPCPRCDGTGIIRAR